MTYGSICKRLEFWMEGSILEVISIWESPRSVTDIVQVRFIKIKCKIRRDCEELLKCSQLISAADQDARSYHATEYLQ